MGWTAHKCIWRSPLSTIVLSPARTSPPPTPSPPPQASSPPPTPSPPPQAPSPLPHSRLPPPGISESACERVSAVLVPLGSFWDPHRGGPHLNSTDRGQLGGGDPPPHTDLSHSFPSCFSALSKKTCLSIVCCLLAAFLPSCPTVTQTPVDRMRLSLRLPSRAWYERLCPWENPGVACHAFCRGSSGPRGRTQVSCISCIGRRVLYQYSHLGSPRP